MKNILSKQLPVAAVLATCLAIPTQAAQAAQHAHAIHVGVADRVVDESGPQHVSLAAVGIKNGLASSGVSGEPDFQRLSTFGTGLSEHRKLQLDALTETLARRYVEKHFDDDGEKRSDVSQAVEVGGHGVLLTISADGTLTGDLASDESDYVVLALPVMAVLALAARLGIAAAIKRFGGWVVQKCARKFLMKLNRNDWNHILKEGHNWRRVTPTHDKSKVASLMAKAYRHGTHRPYGSPKNKSANEAVWTHDGHTIVVTYSKKTGHISDGWIR